jgi:hypothetical protein
MNQFVPYLLVTHPAGGWFRRETLGSKKKKKANNGNFSLSPDSHHSRNGATKRNNPRFNPAP